MNFLAPGSALIAAAIAIPVLVTLYLLKLRRRPMRVSTTAFWEQAEKDLQANVPLRWLKPSWLLFLHLIILGLLILALGRPAAVLPSSFGGASRVILLIDRSASMSAMDGNAAGSAKKSRLEVAKEKALEAIDELAEIGGGRSEMVVTFASDAAALTRWTSSRGLLKDAVTSIEATDQPGDFAGAMKLIEAIASGGGDEDVAADPPLVMVYSDGSFQLEKAIQAAGVRVSLISVPEEANAGANDAGTGAESGATPGATNATGAGASANATTSLRDNVGIVTIAARRDYADPSRVRVLVKVLNAGLDAGAAANATEPAQAQPVAIPLTLSLNGEVIERRVVDVPAPTFVEGKGTQPGVATANFEFLSGEGGLVLVQLSLEDALASDNAAALVVPKPASPSILLYRPLSDGPVVERETPADTPSDWLLEEALRELRPRMLDLRRVPATFVMDQGDLAGHDVIIFDRVTPNAPPPVASLSFGVVPPGIGVRGSVAGAASTDGSPRARAAAGPVLLWERTHPLLRDVALDSLYVGNDIGLASVEPKPESVVVTELARGRDRPLMMLAEVNGLRHIVLGFELSQSNWPAQVSFPIFLAAAMDYLSLRGESSLGLSFTTNAPVTLRTKPSEELAPIVLRGPIEAKATPRRDGEASFGVLNRAGVYLADSPRAIDKAVAVNLVNETESSLAVKREVQVLGALGVAQTGEAQRELWPWFVIAAAGLLFLEWIVYAVRMRA
jgi:hypothetical protein